MNNTRRAIQCGAIRPQAIRSRPAGLPFWAIVVACMTVLRMLAGADQQLFPTALVALFAYAVMPVVCPSCRFDPSMPICPLNLALFIYFVHLVALPLLINFVGPDARDAADNANHLYYQSGYHL